MELIKKFTINDVEYVYNFSQMKAKQVLLCQHFWELSENIKKVIPQNNDELLQIMHDRINEKGYEFLLLMHKDGKYIPMKENQNIGLLDEMNADEFIELEECKADFFQKRGIISENLINITRQLLGNEGLLKLVKGQNETN